MMYHHIGRGCFCVRIGKKGKGFFFPGACFCRMGRLRGGASSVRDGPVCVRRRGPFLAGIRQLAHQLSFGRRRRGSGRRSAEGGADHKRPALCALPVGDPAADWFSDQRKARRQRRAERAQLHADRLCARFDAADEEKKACAFQKKKMIGERRSSFHNRKR